MTDTELTVTVNADTDEAVEAINDVTEAVEDLERALERLAEKDIDVEPQIDTIKSSGSIGTDILEDVN